MGVIFRLAMATMEKNYDQTRDYDPFTLEKDAQIFADDGLVGGQLRIEARPGRPKSKLGMD